MNNRMYDTAVWLAQNFGPDTGGPEFLPSTLVEAQDFTLRALVVWPDGIRMTVAIPGAFDLDNPDFFLKFFVNQYGPIGTPMLVVNFLGTAGQITKRSRILEAAQGLTFGRVHSIAFFELHNGSEEVL